MQPAIKDTATATRGNRIGSLLRSLCLALALLAALLTLMAPQQRIAAIARAGAEPATLPSTALQTITLTLQAFPREVVADGNSHAVVTATLANHAGPVVNDASVILEELAPLPAIIEPSQVQAINPQGFVTVTVRSAQAGVLTLQGTASETNELLPTIESITITFTEESGKPQIDLALNAAPTMTWNGGSVTTVITATVTKKNSSDPEAFVPVTFTASGGAVQPASGQSTLSGIVTTTFAPSAAGTAIVTATTGAKSRTVQISILASPGAGHVSSVKLTASPLTIPANNVTPAIITATVTNEQNQALQGQVVTFTTSSGAVSPSTGTTGEQGTVTTSFKSGQPALARITASLDSGVTDTLQIQVVDTTLPVTNYLPVASNAPALPLVSLKDGSFETGIGWTQDPPDKIIYACNKLQGSSLPAGCVGNKLAWLGGVSQAVTHSIAQPMTLTQLYPVTVRFRYFVASQRAGCDNGVGEMWSGAIKLFTIPLCRSANPSWQPAGVVLPQVDGSQLLKFQAVLPGGVISSFFVDDISLCSTSPFKHPQMPACP